MKSGRCCKSKLLTVNLKTSLNPFEVREVLQVFPFTEESVLLCLNPFEVREVLQALEIQLESTPIGLNPFEVREVLQVYYGLF